MASPFRGFLINSIKIYNDNVAQYGDATALKMSILPLQFIQWDSYKITPNQREELKAYRDDNSRNLTRVTAAGKKTAVQFNLRAMWLEDMMAFQKWLGDGTEDTQEAHEQRKIQLGFYDTEENVYKTGYFYVPNLEYSIIKITDVSIKYKEQQVKFIEY